MLPPVDFILRLLDDGIFLVVKERVLALLSFGRLIFLLGLFLLAELTFNDILSELFSFPVLL